jgi:hypothetical protein
MPHRHELDNANWDQRQDFDKPASLQIIGDAPNVSREMPSPASAHSRRDSAIAT